jgi:hypothetical protein
MRSQNKPVDASTAPVAPSEAARSLRTVLDMLLQDRASTPVDPATLPWNEPILVVRSAPIDRLSALLDEVITRCPSPTLHVLSHARDEDAIRAVAPCGFTFHAYPTPGRYRLEGLGEETLERLRTIGFGTIFFLDTGMAGDLLGEVERLVAGIRDRHAVSFRADGTYARAADWQQRSLADAAFLRLIEWYHFKLDPGFADGQLLRNEVSRAGNVA